MATIDELAALLTQVEFKREAISQLPVVSTLMAGLAMGGVGVVLTSAERTPARAAACVALSLSILVFVFSTLVAATIMPALKSASAGRSPAHLSGLIVLARIAVWTSLLGLFPLFTGVGLLGFMYSRRVGVSVIVSALVVVAMFGACAAYLNSVMYR